VPVHGKQALQGGVDGICGVPIRLEFAAQGSECVVDEVQLRRRVGNMGVQQCSHLRHQVFAQALRRFVGRDGLQAVRLAQLVALQQRPE